MDALPAAVALNSISYNIARSVGPAIGGILVAAAGAGAAFAVNALLYLPLIVALLLWKRVAEPTHLPTEKLNRVVISGVRYIMNSPSVRIVLSRALLTGVISGAIIALMPLMVRDLLHGGAKTYGTMLSAFGLGAVIGALVVAEVRTRMSGEAAIRACALSMGGALATAALSREPILTAAALVLVGTAWTMTWRLFNIGVQLSPPHELGGYSTAARTCSAVNASRSWPGWRWRSRSRKRRAPKRTPSRDLGPRPRTLLR
ncbi:putative MFS family arabinose efflux permease [Bradyrhizobium sp. USDA 3364]